MLELALLILGAVSIFFIAEFFGLEQILAGLAGADPLIAAAAVVAQVLLLSLTALRLMVISRKYARLGFLEAMNASLIGMFVSAVSPLARLGGEPAKVYLLKDKISAEKGSAVIAVDVLAEVISLYIVIMASVVFLQNDIPSQLSPAILPFLIISVFLTVVFVKICTNREWLDGIIGFVSRIPKFSVLKERDYAQRFHESFGELARDGRSMLSVLLISLVMKLLEFARMWLVILALGQLVPFKVVVAVWLVLLVLSAVPWLPGGLGLVEGGMILALVQLGVAPHVAGSAILLDRFISFWLVIAAGFAAVWLNPAITYRFLRKLK
ncbi:MAG: flippase-like domain-containing protein [Candidatus Aenigmarchaeota archaeon]|nr:flippase-like domain-containing protein [Candidatus Aenigmarchaeota archaeon]